MDKLIISRAKQFIPQLALLIDKLDDYNQRNKELETEILNHEVCILEKHQQVKDLQKKVEYLESLLDTVDGRKAKKITDKGKIMFVSPNAKS